MTVIVEATRITVNFVLTVGANEGVSRATFALGSNTLHVGALTIGVNQTKSIWRRSISDCRDFFRWFLTGRDAVSGEAFLADTFKTTNCVGTGGVWVARRYLRRTIVLIDTLNRTEVERNTWLIRELVWKKRNKALLAYTFIPHGWEHIDADRSSRTGELGVTFVYWLTLPTTVSIQASTGTNSISVDVARGSVGDTVSITTIEPPIEGSRRAGRRSEIRTVTF